MRVTSCVKECAECNACDYRLFSYVENGVLHIRPTLTADRFGEDFLYNGTLDLWPEGCNINYNGGCVAYVHVAVRCCVPTNHVRLHTVHF